MIDTDRERVRNTQRQPDRQRQAERQKNRVRDEQTGAET